MLFKDYQFESNKMMKVCFYILLCCNIILFIDIIGIIVAGCLDKETPWQVLVCIGVIVFSLFLLTFICMLAMRFKKLEITKEKIIKTTILNRKKIYEYQPNRLRIMAAPTIALNRGIKLTFFIDEKKLFAYDLVESVASYENFKKRRADWAKALNSIGCLILDPTHCLE